MANLPDESGWNLDNWQNNNDLEAKKRSDQMFAAAHNGMTPEDFTAKYDAPQAQAPQGYQPPPVANVPAPWLPSKQGISQPTAQTPYNPPIPGSQGIQGMSQFDGQDKQGLSFLKPGQPMPAMPQTKTGLGFVGARN